MEDFINTIINLIKDFFATPLPKDTALAVYNTIKDILLPLMQEYIEVLL